MNKIKMLTAEQALNHALIYARIENEEPRCLFSRRRDGLYQFIVRTVCLKYEFYVDAEDGTVLGIDTEPLQYPEALLFCDRGVETRPEVA